MHLDHLYLRYRLMVSQGSETVLQGSETHYREDCYYATSTHS